MKIVKQFFIFLFTFVSVFLVGSPVLAQTTNGEIPEGLESCFQYYDYGKVEVNLAPEKTTYKPGEKVQVSGTVINQNSFPLVDVIIYAQLRRVNTGNVLSEGHHLLERKQITPPMNLLVNETRFLKAEFPLLDTYPNGNYQLQTFVVSQNGFNYAGRPFLEEDFAGTSFFEITQSKAPLVFFNPSSVRVNQQSYPIRGFTREFSANVLNFSTQIVDNRTAKTAIPVTVKFYAFDDTFETYLVDEQKTTAQNGNVSVQFRPLSAGAYVMVMRMDSPTASEIKFRFAQTIGPLPALRVNDLGITSYPPKATDKAYVCFHSPTPKNTAITSVQLEVLDKDKKIISKKSISREFPPEVLAISVPLDTLKDTKDFWVKTIIKAQNEPEEHVVESHYTCEGFGSSPQDLTASFNWGTLSTEAVNSCGQKIDKGGHIDSIRIKNKEGKIVKELYNLDEIKQNVDLKDLPQGEYTAEVKSGELSKNYPVLVGGVSSVNNMWMWAIGIFVLLLALGLWFYYKMRKHKHVDKVPQKV